MTAPKQILDWVKEDDNRPFILVSGNPIDGLTFEGPFEDHDAALSYANITDDDHDWWIAALEPPQTASVATAEESRGSFPGFSPYAGMVIEEDE